MERARAYTGVKTDETFNKIAFPIVGLTGTPAADCETPNKPMNNIMRKCILNELTKIVGGALNTGIILLKKRNVP